MYNKVIILGRITNDLELKTTSSGASMLSFGIAADRRFTPKGEEKKTDFLTAWRGGRRRNLSADSGRRANLS